MCDSILDALLGVTLGAPVNTGSLVFFPLTLRLEVEVVCGAFHTARHEGTVRVEAGTGHTDSPCVCIRNTGPRAVLVPWGEPLECAGARLSSEAPRLVAGGGASLVPVSTAPPLLADAGGETRDGQSAPPCRFPATPDQNGLLCVCGDRALGFDLMSSPEVYATVHPRLVAGYALLARVRRSRPSARPDGWRRAAHAALGEATLSARASQSLPDRCAVHRFGSEYISGRGLSHDGDLVCVSFRL